MFGTVTEHFRGGALLEELCHRGPSVETLDSGPASCGLSTSGHADIV